MKRILWLALGLAVMMVPLAGCSKHDLKDDCEDYCNKLIGCNFDWWELSAAECIDFCRQDVDDDFITETNIDCVLGNSCSALENEVCYEEGASKQLSSPVHVFGSSGRR